MFFFLQQTLLNVLHTCKILLRKNIPNALGENNITDALKKLILKTFGSILFLFGALRIFFSSPKFSRTWNIQQCLLHKNHKFLGFFTTPSVHNSCCSFTSNLN